MKIICKTRELAEELRLLTKVISEKSPIPILSCVLFETENNALMLTATDLEVGLISVCDANIVEEGRITLPCAKLLALLNQLTTEEVTIATNDKGQVLISSGTFKSRLQTWSVDDFPTMPRVEGERLTIDAQLFRSLIAKTNYAVTDKTQMYLVKGAMFSIGKPTAGIVATDGFRISLATALWEGAGAFSGLIPSKTLDTLLALNSEGLIEFSHTDRHLFFMMGGRALFSRRLEGKFPNFAHVPKTLPHKVSIDVQQLAMALRRVAALIEKVPAVTITFAPGVVRFTVKNIEVGDAAEQLDIVYDGPEIKMCMNYTFMLEFLKQAENEVIAIEFKDDTSPMIMIDSNNFMNIILGMRS